MFSKAVITFLAIGALWVNVSAIPIPARGGLRFQSFSVFESPPTHGTPGSNSPSPRPSSVSGTETTEISPPAHGTPGSNSPSPGSPSVSGTETTEISHPEQLGIEIPPPPDSGLKRKNLAMYGGELPRSFSALSYHNLTFVFSVGGVGVLATAGIVGGVVGSRLHKHKHNDTKRELKLESEDSNSVPLPVTKREPMSKDEASDSLPSPLKREPEPAPPSL